MPPLSPLHAIGNLDKNECQEEPSRSASSAFKDKPNSSKSRTIITKNNIPEFLPAEYLEDDPIEDHGSLLIHQQTMSISPRRSSSSILRPKSPKTGERVLRFTALRKLLVMAYSPQKLLAMLDP